MNHSGAWSAESSDESLVDRDARAGRNDRLPLANELCACYERSSRWCYQLTGDREAAADLAEVVFCQASVHLDRLPDTTRCSTWLCSMARRLGQLVVDTLDETERVVFTQRCGHGAHVDAIPGLLGLENGRSVHQYVATAKRELAVAIRAWHLVLARGPGCS